MRSGLKKTLWLVAALFIFLNAIAFFHAYRFTHFSEDAAVKTRGPAQLSFGEKAKAIFFGVSNPRPENTTVPGREYKTVKLQSKNAIVCWSVAADSPKGTVVLFHGYGGSKSSLIDKSDEFLMQGYSTLLVDFMGSGDSEGNQTTIGFKEAGQVKALVDHLEENGEKNIVLFGTSLGAVAIMKSVKDYQLRPAGIIVECPFGSMYRTVCARFRSMHVPSFPMAPLLVFWGGLQNGFWAFGHNPIEYARHISCPTLLLYGGKDEKVSMEEINEMYANLRGKKALKIYPLAGHENYLHRYRKEWVADTRSFLRSLN